MPLPAEIVGLHYRHPDHYDVGREKIREFARSVKDENPCSADDAVAAEHGHDTLLAPLTFTSIFGYQCQIAFFTYAGIDITDAQIFQVDQRLIYVQPIKAGDRIFCDIYVDSVRESFGVDVVELKNVVTVEDGSVVQIAYTTLAGRSGQLGSGFDTGLAGPPTGHSQPWHSN